MKNYKNKSYKELVGILETMGVKILMQPTEVQILEVDSIAADCMAAYDPLPGDRELMGWIPVVGKIQVIGGSQFEPDGIVFIGAEGDNRAIIGISTDILNNPEYSRVGAGLHEVTHLSVAEHNEKFTSRLLELQFNYYRLKAATSAGKKKNDNIPSKRKNAS